MSATATATLGDEIEVYLERSGPASCDGIAEVIRRRRSDVLAALRGDPRFARSGRSYRTRWQLAANEDEDGHGTGSTLQEARGATNGASSPCWSWERLPPSRCAEPVTHEGNRARYTLDGVRWCIVCDGPPVARPVTLEEFLRGEGGEERLNQFEADWLAVRTKTATPEQIERFRYALGAPSDAQLDTVRGLEEAV